MKLTDIGLEYSLGTCPIAVHLAFVQVVESKSCGKCTPCRDGFVQVEKLLRQILDCTAKKDDFDNMIELLTIIKQTADCAIGYHSAKLLLNEVEAHKDEYNNHLFKNICSAKPNRTSPCTAACPANVDVPGYVALVSEGRYEDAIKLIRNDNPFVTACAFVCEHPCEAKCRRVLLDDAINIRALKKYAVNKIATNKTSPAKKNVKTGKKIAVVGAGPSGLTCAYYLALMGHEVCVFESHSKAGGMLRYGIPNYRLPKDRLDQDIEMILKAGNIKIKYDTLVKNLEKVIQKFDAVYLSIGAQIGKGLNIEGNDSPNVISAVDFLNDIGEGWIPDYSGKNVVVIGGGNVAMDAARSAVRCGAASTTIVYRRRQDDMTALADEVQGAIEEGVELLCLHAPKAIKHGKFVAQPQLIGAYDGGGRPRPVDAKKEPVELDADIVLMAIGQNVDTSNFSVECHKNIFAGGDCVTGPATVIKAIAAGKKAAVGIDEYLGCHHKFKEKIEIPHAKPNLRDSYGRVNLTNLPASARKQNFDPIENNMSDEEAMQECGKCLRCDHFGCGCIEGGRF